MSDNLTSYLDAHPWHHETIERWPIQGALRVRLSLAVKAPPPLVTSSILAIVVNSHSQLLYLWPSEPTGSIAHLLIGGRSKPAETPEETVIREVGEETGWRVAPKRMIGFRHFFHLEPQRAQSDRPYPDFVQPIYAALAQDFDQSLLIHGDHITAEFLDFATVESKTEVAQCPLLQAALKEIKSI